MSATHPAPTVAPTGVGDCPSWCSGSETWRWHADGERWERIHEAGNGRWRVRAVESVERGGAYILDGPTVLYVGEQWETGDPRALLDEIADLHRAVEVLREAQRLRTEAEVDRLVDYLAVSMREQGQEVDPALATRPLYVDDLDRICGLIGTTPSGAAAAAGL